MGEDGSGLEKLSMEAKLHSHYAFTLNNGNGGHACGYYKGSLDGIIPDKYKFEKGTFSVRCISPDKKFYQWDYDPEPDDQ